MEDVSGVSILTNLTHLEIARRYNRPLIFAPQSFGPFKNTISRKWASSIVNYASLVFVREPLSYDYVKKEFGVSDEKTFLVSDMAFYYYGSNCKGARMLTEKLKLDDVFFGTTVLDYGFSESQSPTETRRKYFENIIEVAKRIYAELEIKTVFFRLTHTTRDKNTLLSILDKIGNTGVVILDMLELDTLRSMIARCSVFYGTRFHSNIFAISSGVPVVAVAYQPKAFGIMKMCKQDDYIVDIYNFTADELFNKIRRAYENRDGIRQELDAFHASVQSDRNLLKEKLMSITK